MTKFLLMKRGLYWRPDGCGYTGLKREAGRYSDEDSVWVKTNRAVHELRTTRILESKAPRFALSCASDIRQRETERCLDGALKLVRKSIQCEEDRRKKLKTGSVAAGFCDGRLEELRSALAELEG